MVQAGGGPGTAAVSEKAVGTTVASRTPSTIRPTSTAAPDGISATTAIITAAADPAQISVRRRPARASTQSPVSRPHSIPVPNAAAPSAATPNDVWRTWCSSTPAQLLTAPSANSPLKATIPSTINPGWLRIRGPFALAGPVIGSSRCIGLGPQQRAAAHRSQPEHRHGDHGERHPGRRPEGDGDRTAEAAEQGPEAPHRVQTRHDRPADDSLQRHRLDVDGDVDRPVAQAERDEGRGEGDQAAGQPDQDQGGGREGDGADEQGRARAARDQRRYEAYGAQQPGRGAGQRDGELGRAQMQVVTDEGDLRPPGGVEDPEDEQAQADGGPARARGARGRRRGGQGAAAPRAAGSGGGSRSRARPW